MGRKNIQFNSQRGTVHLAPPWITYVKRMQALFGKDPDIRIDWQEDETKLVLRVNGQKKANALSKILSDEVWFGTVALHIEVVPSNEDEEETLLDIFKDAFEGNPVVSYIDTTRAPMFSAGYVVFKPAIAQYFNDNLSDANGMESILYEDIAGYIFPEHDGVFFCTDILPE